MFNAFGGSGARIHGLEDVQCVRGVRLCDFRELWVYWVAVEELTSSCYSTGTLFFII